MAPRGDDEHPVSAKLTDLDPDLDPIPAAIVTDQRYSLGKRLGYLALALLALFFVISGYIQGAKNGSAVRQAAVHDSKENARLLDDVDRLSESNARQTKLVKQLQQAIRAQNRELRKAGLETIPVPGESPSTSSSGPRNNHPDHSHPSPKPSNSPHPRPSHTPSPTPSSVNNLEDRICDLTGICLFNFFKFIFF